VVAVTRAGEVSSDVEVDALCRGAAVLSREDNRIAARALLWAAVAIDPQNFVAHRRLAAALLNGEDVDAAAEEYARFIELLLKDDVHRAAAELAYARSFLGDMPQLRPAADHLVPLGDIAHALDSSSRARSSPPLALADYIASRAPSQPARSEHRRWTPNIGIGEKIFVLALLIAAAVALLRLTGYIAIGAP
jgi:tetratricopeptide (TPR) repeat protein